MLVLGVQDYARNVASARLAGLSGGIDSALVVPWPLRPRQPAWRC